MATPTKKKSVQFNCQVCNKRTRATVSSSDPVLTICQRCQVKAELRQEIWNEQRLVSSRVDVEAMEKRKEKARADRRYDVVDAFDLPVYAANAVVRLLNTDCNRSDRIKHLERAEYYVQRELSQLRNTGVEMASPV